MIFRRMLIGFSVALVSSLAISTDANAHKLRAGGKTVDVAGSDLVVTPSRDWNKLGEKIGKSTESWTLDGEQLNDVTFFAGIESGKPLVKERDKKRDPLPKFSGDMLLIEIPELLEGTYRTYKSIATFELLSSEPISFLEAEGVLFKYRYIDEDELTRDGEARAAMVDGKLYMITFDAPRLNYFERTIEEFRAIADSARRQ